MASAVREPVAYELADYGRLLRRRGWIVLVLALLGLVAGQALLQSKPKVYTSTVSVIVRSVGDSGAVEGGRTGSAVNLDTEAQLVRSEALAADVATALASADAPATLASRVSVSVPPNTSVLTISYDGPSRRDAQQGADTYAQVYLDTRRTSAQADLASNLTSLQVQADKLELSLRNVAGRIASLPSNSPDRALALAQQNVLVNQLTSVQTRISPLVGQEVNAGRVISEASRPSGPSSPVPLLYRLGGLLVGLLFGMTAAAFLDRTDKRVRRAHEIERLLDVPLLGTIPRVRQISVVDGGRQSGEAFRGLRNAVEAQLGSSASVLVAGASRGAGGPFVAGNLAAALAQSGRRTVVTCMDGRSGDTAKALGVTSVRAGSAGATLDGTGALVLPHPDIRGLSVWLPAEGATTSPRSGPAFEAVVRRLRLQHEYVVMAAPSTSESAYAQELGFTADAALVVAEVGRTRQDQVADAVDQFGRVRCSVLGAVAVTVPKARARGRRVTGAGAATSGTEVLPEREVVPSLPSERPSAAT